MEFKVYAKFVDWLGKIEQKEEVTYEWQQAFGAFTIYSSHPDCTYCTVYYTIRGYNKITLEYRQVTID